MIATLVLLYYRNIPSGDKMKAYCVFIDNPFDGCLLVFAKTRGRAKMMWWDNYEYTAISANRIKIYDEYIEDDKPREFMDNDDLLAFAPNAPLFYTKEI